MSKENKYKNESEEYELNYNLRKNGYKENDYNRGVLRSLANVKKVEDCKETLTNKDYDEIIKKNKGAFEKK